jgi:hypothetical protein
MCKEIRPFSLVACAAVGGYVPQGVRALPDRDSLHFWSSWPGSLFPPIERTSLQLPTKTGHLKGVFQCFSRVRSTESSEYMERAMGIGMFKGIENT